MRIKSTKDFCLSFGSIKLLLLQIQLVEKQYCCLPALIFSVIFQSEELSKEYKMNLSQSPSSEGLSFMFISLIVQFMKMNKFKNKKIQETKLHAIPRFPVLIICGPIGGSFAVRNHLRSSLGIICGRGSFAALHSTQMASNHKQRLGLIKLWIQPNDALF